MSREPVDTLKDEAGKAEKRTPRSIRFYDPEWGRIEAFAEGRGLAAAEFVRFAALSAIESGAAGARLAPLIERTFRFAYIVATKMRDEMRAAGHGEELEVLIREARALQDDVLERAQGRDEGGTNAGGSGLLLGEAIR